MDSLQCTNEYVVSSLPRYCYNNNVCSLGMTGFLPSSYDYFQSTYRLISLFLSTFLFLGFALNLFSPVTILF